MSSLKEYISGLKDLSDNLDIHIEKIILKHSGELLSTIKLRLFGKGIDAAGKTLGEYSKRTIKRKQDKGQPSTHITLRDSGDFYDGMFIKYKDGDIIIDSSDNKTSELEFLYGEAILGLTEDEQNNFIDSILEPEIQKLINNLGNIEIEF